MLQKKSLGQNFLKSKKALSDIVLAGKIQSGETALEAGPGTGALTEHLLAAGARVTAVEKDRRLIPLLKEKFFADIVSKKLTLIEGDILEIPISSLGLSKYKVIANIPYYITGQFLRNFLGSETQPSDMVLLVQKEVAERIVARDGKESILSISVKAYGTPRYVETVKAGSFSPAPNVDSAILSIENISKKNFSDFSEKKFFTILKAGFAHKRKLLSGNTGIPEEVLAKLGIPSKARAENLRLDDWKKLAKL